MRNVLSLKRGKLTHKMQNKPSQPIFNELTELFASARSCWMITREQCRAHEAY